MTIPTMIWFMDNEWDEFSLPGPAYLRRYGVDPGGPEASGETQEQYDKRMRKNKERAEDFEE
jgi:hypothetical protein